MRPPSRSMVLSRRTAWGPSAKGKWENFSSERGKSSKLFQNIFEASKNPQKTRFLRFFTFFHVFLPILRGEKKKGQKGGKNVCVLVKMLNFQKNTKNHIVTHARGGKNPLGGGGTLVRMRLSWCTFL